MEPRQAHRTEVVYYGRQIRSSLGWLALALFFGGLPVIVYFTTPQPAIAMLALGLILGLPLFVLSLIDLGKTAILILNPQARQLKYIEGFFARRKTRGHSYEEVRQVYLTHGKVGPYRGSTSEWWYLHLGFDRESEIVLEQSSHDEATRCARRLGAAFGIQPLFDGRPVVVAMEAVPRAATLSRWNVLFYALFGVLGAIVIILAVLSVFFRFAKP